MSYISIAISVLFGLFMLAGAVCFAFASVFIWQETKRAKREDEIFIPKGDIID